MLNARRSYVRAPGLKMPIDIECNKVISTAKGIRIFSWVINPGTIMPSLRPCRSEDRSQPPSDQVSRSLRSHPIRQAQIT